MILVKPEDWSARRDFLNHYVLCNQLRVEIAALKLEPCRKATFRLEQWPSHEEKYKNFFDSAPEALSLRHLLEHERFVCWSDEMQQACGEVFHEIFLASSHLEYRIKKLHALLAKGLDLTREVLHTRPEERTISMIIELEKVLCALSQEISSLPEAIIVHKVKANYES